MIWYLLFCASTGSYRGGITCNVPVRTPDQATCVFMAKNMMIAASDVGGGGSGRCVSVRKPLT